MSLLSTKHFVGDAFSYACYGRMSTFYHQLFCRGELLRQICARPISGWKEMGDEQKDL